MLLIYTWRVLIYIYSHFLMHTLYDKRYNQRGNPNITMWNLLVAVVITGLLSGSVRGQLKLNIDVVVAQDGTGKYTKISDAILAAPDSNIERYNIKIKEGRYLENIIIRQKKSNITLIGDGIDKTIISGNKSTKMGLATMDTATVGMVYE